MLHKATFTYKSYGHGIWKIREILLLAENEAYIAGIDTQYVYGPGIAKCLGEWDQVSSNVKSGEKIPGFNPEWMVGYRLFAKSNIHGSIKYETEDVSNLEGDKTFVDHARAGR